MMHVDLPRGWLDKVVLSESDNIVLADKKLILPDDEYNDFFYRYNRQSWILQNNDEYNKLIRQQEKRLLQSDLMLHKESRFGKWMMYASVPVFFLTLNWFGMFGAMICCVALLIMGFVLYDNSDGVAN